MAIQFPDIDPVAISIGPLGVRWYALAYLAGFLIGWRYILYLVEKGGYHKAARPITKAAIDDFLPWAILGIILGGRIGYVLFYQLGFYLQHPAEIVQIWQGGMSFHGGAAGAIITMIIYARAKDFSLLKLTDLFCCAVPIGLFFGRIANFVNGELYGRITNVSWGIIFPHGGPFPRHPSQLYEAALEGVVLFAVLCVIAHKPDLREKPGLISGVFLIGYGLFRAIIEFFREPDQQIGYFLNYFTMGQILCVPMIAGGLYLVYLAYKGQIDKDEKPTKKDTKNVAKTKSS